MKSIAQVHELSNSTGVKTSIWLSSKTFSETGVMLTASLLSKPLQFLPGFLQLCGTQFENFSDILRHLFLKKCR